MSEVLDKYKCFLQNDQPRFEVTESQRVLYTVVYTRNSYENFDGKPQFFQDATIEHIEGTLGAFFDYNERWSLTIEELCEVLAWNVVPKCTKEQGGYYKYEENSKSIYQQIVFDSDGDGKMDAKICFSGYAQVISNDTNAWLYLNIE